MFKTKLLNSEEAQGARLIQRAMSYCRCQAIACYSNVDKAMNYQDALLLLKSVYQAEFCEET